MALGVCWKVNVGIAVKGVFFLVCILYCVQCVLCTVFTWLLMDRILGVRAVVEWVLVRLGGGLCLGLLVCVSMSLWYEV